MPIVSEIKVLPYLPLSNPSSAQFFSALWNHQRHLGIMMRGGQNWYFTVIRTTQMIPCPKKYDKNKGKCKFPLLNAKNIKRMIYQKLIWWRYMAIPTHCSCWAPKDYTKDKTKKTVVSLQLPWQSTCLKT